LTALPDVPIVRDVSATFELEGRAEVRDRAFEPRRICTVGEYPRSSRFREVVDRHNIVALGDEACAQMETDEPPQRR
jgi:hypothetical protein